MPGIDLESTEKNVSRVRWHLCGAGLKPVRREWPCFSSETAISFKAVDFKGQIQRANGCPVDLEGASIKMNGATLPHGSRTLPLSLLLFVSLTCTASLAQEQPSGQVPVQGQQVQGQQAPAEHPLVPAIQLATQSYNVLRNITDYEATLIKQELVNGRLITQRMKMRLKEEPFSVHLYYEEPNAGRQILYVSGQNNNQLLAKEATGLSSLVGTVQLALDSPQVMAENRHVITDLGMRRMLEMLVTQWNLESKFGEVDVKYYPNAKMGNAECEVVEVIHPRPRKQFPFHMTRLFIEKQSRLPIRIENYGFPAQAGQPAQLQEEYTYVNVKTNIGLTAADFDRRNPRYSFQ